MKTADIYRTIATVYDSTGEVHKAKKFYQKAMDIAKQTFGEKNWLVAAAIYHNLERLYQRTEENN